jgi:hypothetical protein
MKNLQSMLDYHDREYNRHAYSAKESKKRDPNTSKMHAKSAEYHQNEWKKIKNKINENASVEKSEGTDAQAAQNGKEMYNPNPELRSTTKFVAFNASNVSQKLIDHINANDHVGLSQASRSLHDASDVIASWVENSRGTIISRTSDEVIAMVPEEALQGLEEVKNNYKNLSGHDLVCGIGDSLADAANSLVGNKNAADSMENEEEDLDNDGTPDLEEDHGEIDPEQDDLDGDGEVNHEEAEESDELEDAEGEDIPPEGDVAEEDFVEGEATASEVEDNADEEVADEYSEEVPEMEDRIPEHEEGLTPEEKELHDSTESETDEEEIAEEDDAAMAERDIEDEDDIEETAEIPELDESECHPGDEDCDDGIDESGDDLNEFDENDPDMVDEPDLSDDEQELFNLLSQDLNDQPESANMDDAKARLIDTLNTLKANKDSIEAMKETDPDSYASLVEFIRSMIDMAKHISSGSESSEETPENDTEEDFEENPKDSEDSEEETQEVKKPQG